MRPEQVPIPTIRRLSLYLRQLDNMREAEVRTVSSRQLGAALNLTDAQVRKDLGCFGQFGHPGIGYKVDDLAEKIRHILGADQTWNVVLVGAGSLGRALARYERFAAKGYRLVGVYDQDPNIIGTTLSPESDQRVQPLSELEKLTEKEEVLLGIVCVPAQSAQEVTNRLVAAGIKGVLNFAPIALIVPDGVVLAGVDLAVQLEQLSFQVRGNLNPA